MLFQGRNPLEWSTSAIRTGKSGICTSFMVLNLPKGFDCILLHLNPGPETFQKNTEVVCPHPALPDSRGLYLYPDPVRTKLDRQAGDQPTIQRPAHKSQYRPY